MTAGPVFKASRKVLTPDEMNAVSDAARFLAEARRLQARAQQEVAEATESASRKGYEAGYADGRRAALADLAAGVADAREQVHAVESDLAVIVMAALERLLGQFDQAELARLCLRRALQDAAQDIWAVIRVCPEEHAMFADDLKTIPLDAGWPELRSLEPDPLLKAGEILIETPKGRIHVGLRQQMSRLQSGLARLES